jgi:hypothetical protein
MLGEFEMNEWIEQIFAAQAAQNGGVVRRSVVDVENFASRQALVNAVRRRNFHLVETGGQFVIFCNQGDFQLHC